jgi:hypothetical protein
VCFSQSESEPFIMIVILNAADKLAWWLGGSKIALKNEEKSLHDLFKDAVTGRNSY